MINRAITQSLRMLLLSLQGLIEEGILRVKGEKEPEIAKEEGTGQKMLD